MGQQSRLLCGQFGRSSVIALLLLVVLGNVCFEQGSATVTYSTYDLAALQDIFAAWNQTQDQSSNLYGWSTTQKYPCQNLRSPKVTFPNWRGVQCLKQNFTEDENNITNSDVVVVGLSISNASIVGTLSPSIQYLTWLTTLELTGNPNLTGPLPIELQNLWLNVLDVHDNGFNGTIPNWNFFWNLVQLDLSGNQFTGLYPFNQLSAMHYLQVLSIGHNFLTGPIPSYAFQTNKTELEKLDISNNQFTGELPDLSQMSKLIYLDVSGNHFVGSLPDLRIFSALQTVNFGRNNFSWTGNLQDTFNLSANLDTLDLSGNHLSGRIPAWNFTNLGTIQELYLHNNSLSGVLDLVGMNERHLLLTNSDSNSTKKLKILNLSNNKITDVIYDAFSIANITTVIKLDGNPYCDHYDSGNDGQRCFCNQICFVNPVKANNRKVVIAAVTTSVLSMILILAVVVGAILYKNRRYKKYLQLQFSKKFEEYDIKPTIFSYNELRAATRDFHDDMKLGQGGYGAVYKGIFPNGNVVAVKQLFIKTSQGLDEFSNEVVLITGMKHRNLVNLKGCCLREHQRLLVYEYVDNFDVDQILLGSRRQVVSWAVRLKICLGIARGLHYLHALAHPRVIHRDIKASNVLLDKNMEPKIADFGLALLFPDEQSHIMTVHVAGTKGYLAPEYASLGQLSDKVDVYSFGVLCLEIISGRRNIDESYPLDQVYLSKWAWILHEQNRLPDLVDRTLHLTDDDVRDVQRVINVCLLCIHNTPEKRPSMARIVSILQSDTESEVLVLGEGKSEPAYKPGTRSQRGSVDYRNYSNSGLDSGLDSVLEEGSSSGNAYYQGNGRPRRGPSDDLSVAVELSQIRAR